MRVLVTGSSGHLGEALVRTLRRTDHEVVGLDRKASPFTALVGTITDGEFVRSCMQGVDAVVHAATLHKPHVATHTRREFVDTNVSGTLNVLEEAVSAGVSRFLFTSTTSAFGGALKPPPGAPAAWVTEDVQPGMVLAIDPQQPGKLSLSRGAYNRMVAGVVSGANGLPAGTIMGNLPGHENAPAVALTGRVWVQCDATRQAINPGDLMTTAGRAGYAMSATDAGRAHGAVVRALDGHVEGARPLRPLSRADLMDLFLGPDRVFHLREDAASMLHARSRGLPGAVALVRGAGGGA